MILQQEFLVLKSGDRIVVHTPRSFPTGTPVGRDAERMVVSGPSRVPPPEATLCAEEFEAWRRQLDRSGYTVTLGPYWRDPVSPEQFDEAVRRGGFVPLEDAFDELLREAERRSEGQDQPLETVESRRP